MTELPVRYPSPIMEITDGVRVLGDGDNVDILHDGSHGYIRTTANDLYLQDNIAQDIKLWSNITSGNPIFEINGWDSSASTRKYMRFNVDSSGVGTINPEEAINIWKARVITFDAEYDNGNSGSSKTINWNNGQKQKITLTDNCTFTFTAPTSGIGVFRLKLIQDGTGSRTVTWPANVKWPNSTPPTLTTTANAYDIIAFDYDGTNYNGGFNLNYG